MVSHLLLAVGDPRNPPPPSSSSLHCRATSCLSRSEAAQLMDELLLPATERGHRITLGLQKLPEEVAVYGHDPVLAETYGEFPLSSLDVLLDRAEALLDAEEGSQQSPTTSKKTRRRTIVDVGSGCGRLALYLALSRPSWDVYGVEISRVLSQEAFRAVNRAIDQGCLQTAEYDDENDQLSEPHSGSLLTLYCGPAQEYSQLLERADLVFCYSTAFESAGFSEGAGGMILGQEWSTLFAVNARGLCITTDKALEPAAGWAILDRVDVPNPEVFRSTGYIQRLLTVTR